MSSTKWIFILGLLVFGIGFAVGVISLQIVEGAPPPSRMRTEGDGADGADHRRDGKWHHGSRKSRLGPYLGSVQEFAETLGLDETQQGQLSRVLQETVDEVARREQDISNLLLAHGRRVDQLLTSDQRTRLEGLMREEWEERRKERVDQAMAWFRAETDLDEDALTEVQSILRRYEEDKGAYFRDLRRTGSWPNRKEMEAALRALAEERTARLSPWLGAEEIGRYEASSACSWRRR